ncbi:MAG: type II secretion system F family protein [Oscillospiraceae bacterium]|nr:type II secretion system F family protein [Oscillospiraceae bacterium]
MNKVQLSKLQIADLCRELALMLHAGIGTGDGLFLLAEEEKDAALKEMLTDMAKAVDAGAFLAQAFEDTCCFPVYMSGLLNVGERVGRLEEALMALSRYYESKDRLERQITNALTYPVILLILMLVVIVVLLTRVLPVFNDVYASLGGQLTGVAWGLLVFGQALDKLLPVLVVILAVVLILLAVFVFHSGLRAKMLALWNRHFGDKGVSRKLNNARFAQALSMGLSSGLSPEEAVDMAALLLADIPKAAERCKKCRDLLLENVNLADALGEAELMSPSACRLLTLGIRSGSGDTVMEDLANRMQEEAHHEVERTAAKVEPALVLITTVLVGAILLSVMLPLMNIMTTIG